MTALLITNGSYTNLVEDGFTGISTKFVRIIRKVGPPEEKLAARYRVEMPITQQLALILFEELDPHDAVLELMLRNPKGKLEEMA